MIAEPAALPSSNRSGPAWRAWIIFWSAVIVCVGALLADDAHLDTFLWCSTRWAAGDGDNYRWESFTSAHAADVPRYFYMTEPPPMNSKFLHRTGWFWTFCKRCGEAWATLFAVALIAVFHRRRRLLAGAAVLGAALVGFLGWLIRTLDGRYRPTHTDGANHWEICRGFYNGTDLSFPSGHATLAFATAATLSYVFPRGRPLFITLAALTAISRVVQEAHFWSDVICGSTLGWSIAWFTMYYADKLLATWPPYGKTEPVA